MLSILKYLRYITIHKWYVMVECFKRGLFIQGLLHDASKLLPCEFIPYMNFFTKKDKSDTAKQAFNKAWLHHIHCNPHHWQYWMLQEEGNESGLKIFEIPHNYVIEMICDWEGMSKIFKSSTKEWYSKNKDKMVLHEETRKKIELLLEINNKEVNV